MQYSFQNEKDLVGGLLGGSCESLLHATMYSERDQANTTNESRIWTIKEIADVNH
jgi:hypothetical protein